MKHYYFEVLKTPEAKEHYKNFGNIHQPRQLCKSELQINKIKE
jgi:hypothetical protein